jgi:hypothetical protein
VVDVAIQCICVKTADINLCPPFLNISWKNSSVPVTGENVNSTHVPDISVPAASTLVRDDEADNADDELDASSEDASVEAATSSSSASAQPNTRPLSALPQIISTPISERYKPKKLPAGSKRYMITSDHLKKIGTQTMCKKKPLFCPNGRKNCHRPCKKNF